MSIKLMKYYAQNIETGAKARCWYSHGRLINGRDCVTVYAKTCLENLFNVFGGAVENNSEMQTDYFENDKYRIYPENPLWAEAVARANRT